MLSNTKVKDEELDYVVGENGSSAEKMVKSNQWIVKGAHDVLGQADPNELGFKIDLNAMDVKHLTDLPDDAPIYAGVYSWEYQSGVLTDDFETVKDLRAYVENGLQDFLKKLSPEEHKHVSPTIRQRSDEIFQKLGEQIFYDADWTSLSTEADEIFDDLRECLKQEEYEAYPYLLNE